MVQVGTIGYEAGLRLQKKLVDLRKAGAIGDVLLLLEHNPVITLGRNAKAANVLATVEELAARGVEVFECDRGGDVTFHGPGQVVGYPIFDLRGFESCQLSVASSQEKQNPTRKTMGVIDYVRRLEEVLIRCCADFGIASRRVRGWTGVWTAENTASGRDVGRDPSTAQGDRFADRATPPRMTSEAGAGEARANTGGRFEEEFAEKKIAALGVHISRSVTSHGFALNVNTDLSYFDLIVPCGIVAKGVTSMKKELGRDVEMEPVAQSLSRNFGNVFGRQMLWVESVEALLGETVGVPVKAPEELRRMRGEEEIFLA